MTDSKFSKKLSPSAAEVAAKSETSRLAVLGELTAGIVHEINNPLLLIQGYAEVLKTSVEEDKIDPKKFKKTLDKIMDSVGRITKIINNIKAFSRNSENEELKEILVTDFIHESIDFCSQRIEDQGISLTVSEKSEVRLQCRPVQLSQVVVNLINNAIDAIAAMPDKWIEIDIASQDDQVEISIMDSGTGISEEVKSKIMQPFFTTKAVGKGTGLGLSISKAIVESHGGRLWIDDSVDHTKFVISLPNKLANPAVA
jgi:signal transduction histidine kinase